MKKAEVLKHIGQEATEWQGVRYRRPAHRVRIEGIGYRKGYGFGSAPIADPKTNGVLVTYLNGETGEPIVAQYGARAGQVSTGVARLQNLDATPWTEVKAKRKAAADEARRIDEELRAARAAVRDRLEKAREVLGGEVRTVGYGSDYFVVLDADQAEDLVARLEG